MAIVGFSVQRTGDEAVDRNLDLIKRSIDSIILGVAALNGIVVTLDFGTGNTEASTVVSASWATPSSKITASLADDSRLDDALGEGILVGVTGRSTGFFTVSGQAPATVTGKYNVAVVGV